MENTRYHSFGKRNPWTTLDTTLGEATPQLITPEEGTKDRSSPIVKRNPSWTNQKEEYTGKDTSNRTTANKDTSDLKDD